MHLTVRVLIVLVSGSNMPLNSQLDQKLYSPVLEEKKKNKTKPKKKSPQYMFAMNYRDTAGEYEQNIIYRQQFETSAVDYERKYEEKNYYNCHFVF